MFEAVKDFFVFAYNATEKMEERAKEINEDRRKRWDEFREKSASTKQGIKDKMENRKTEMSDSFRNELKGWIKGSGFATKEEIEHIHKDMTRIENKLDELLKK